MGPLTGGDQLSLSHGPPASDKQVAYLLALLSKAGHTGFRDARRPLGLTQRQGAGKFTRSEASALIEQLLDSDDTPPTNDRPWSQPTLTSTVTSRPPATDAPGEAGHGEPGEPGDLADEPARLRHLPAEALANELMRRGWSVSAPSPADPPAGQPAGNV